MRVLVTGLDGFTGQYLWAELTACGHETCGLGADLTDEVALAAEVHAVQPDAILHLAGIAFIGHGTPNDFYGVNLVGTRNLLAALASLAEKPRCVLLASSANIYGNAVEGMLDESTAPNPVNDYAVSKLAMEYMARLWLPKLPIVIVRPFNYTGIGQSESFLIPKIVGHFRRRAPEIELGNLDVYRDFSDVRDVAKAYRRLLESAPAGGTFNVCSGSTHSLHDILSICQRLTGHTINVRVNPSLVRANEIKTLSGNPDRLSAAIGQWQTVHLEDTLSWMLRG